MAGVLASIASVVMCSAGCAQLAGIDSTSGDARGGDAVTMSRVSIGSDVRTADLDLASLTAVYFVPSAGSPTGFDRVRAANAGQGRWTADLPAPAPVQLTVPDVPPVPRLFDFPSRELKVPFRVLEHPNPQPAPAGALVNLTVTLDAPTDGTEGFQIFTVGAWTQRLIAAAELPMMGAMELALGYAFDTSTSLSGRAQLDRLTVDDRYLVLRYVGTGLTGVAEPLPFDQTGDDLVTATMMPVTADQRLDVRITPSQLTRRFASVRPAVAALQMTWALHAAPGAASGEAAGPALQSGVLTEADAGVNVAYGNPFIMYGWRAVFTLETTETRVYTPPDTTTPVTLTAGMTQVIEPSDGFVLDQPAGLPVLISLDGKPLSTDGEVVAKPSKFVAVSFVADSPTTGAPNATLYQLEVFDLVPNAAGTGLEPHLVWTASASAPTFQVPPETFEAGHSYTLRATCQLGGYPAIASGDLVTRTLPVAQSFLDSAVIAVTP